MAADATQYLLSEGVGLDAALSELSERFDVASDPSEPTRRTFYDTFDGRLHAAGLALIDEDGRLVAGAGPCYRELATAIRPAAWGERLFAGDLPDGPLRSLIGPIIEVRALVPVARTRGRARAVRVLNGDVKTVVRLVLGAESAVLGGGGDEVRLRTRLHVVGVRGYDRALARVRRTLSGELGLEESGVALHDEAVRAGGGIPGGVSTRLDLRLAGDGPALAGAVVAMGEMLRTIELTLPGVVADVDSEFLHDLRVAVRRTRSIQRQLASEFPAEPLGRFRREFRWLGQVTGPARDLDVLVLDLAAMRAQLPEDRASELDPLGDLLHRRRERERRRLVGALESDRTRGLLAGWSEFLGQLGRAGVNGGGDRLLGMVVGERIRRVYRQMSRAGRSIDDGSPAMDLHDLRKQGKELRYLLEIFAGLYPAEAVRPTVRRLKALQETLGRFQDREVQATMLRSLGGELVAADGGPAALLTLGVVLERIEADGGAARAEFAERFAVYSAAGQRRLIRDSFR
jgi:CHAD domain-containing protein